MTKRSNYIFAAALAIALLLSCAASAEDIPVPEGHWSVKALASLAERELVPGYRDFDFSGRKTFTRTEVAAIVVNVVDHYFSDPAKFSTGDAETVRRLAAEFREELLELGYTRSMPEPQAQEPTVPPTHWAYAVLRGFASRDLVPGADAADFSPETPVTRSRMARFTAAVREKADAEPYSFSPEDLKNIEYLEIEFKKELAAPSPEIAKPGKPRTPERLPFSYNGSSNLSVRVAKGEKTDISNRLSVETVGGGVKTYFSGNLDNSDADGPDVDLGHSYGFETTRRLLEYHTNPGDVTRDSFVMLGDVNSVDFAGGLMIGALNMKGLYSSMKSGGAGRYIFLWGENNRDDELAALRYQYRRGRNEPGWSWGTTYVKEYPGPGDSLESFGLDMECLRGAGRFRGEMAWSDAAGTGFYFDYRHRPAEALEMNFELRRYRNFTMDHNSPRMYLGRSGGDDENERSWYAGLKWEPRADWTVRLNRDHAYTGLNGRRTNVFFSTEHVLSAELTAAAALEKERGGTAAETEKTLKARYTGLGRNTLYGTWKRGFRSSGPSSTTRLDISRPLHGLDGKLIYSFSRRFSSGSRTNTSSLRISWRFGAAIFASLTYNYSGTAASALNTNVSWRF